MFLLMDSRCDPFQLRTLPDEVIWRECRWEAFRGSGPGGQKRNKTSSAVRVIHEPTGLAVVASESRSQSENRQRAFRRLRRNLAFEIRQDMSPESFQIPEWFKSLLDKSGRLRVSAKHELFLAAGGLALDVLAATSGSVADAADLLNLTTGNLVSFLETDEVLWSHVNRIRLQHGLKSLNR